MNRVSFMRSTAPHLHAGTRRVLQAIGAKKMWDCLEASPVTRGCQANQE